jgi:dTDP-4-amino-4,6-dideoxygalactose transaminase
MQLSSGTAIVEVPFVDLKAQYVSIKEGVDAAIARVISDCAFVGGPYVSAFEREFAAFCGVEHCIGVANGTDALLLALRAVGVGRGDEVITAANSFIATSEAITLTGAKVSFVDIGTSGFNSDIAQIEEKITPKTKAIVPVHLYGQPADMQGIRRLAQNHGLHVIADAAQAHAATYHNRPIAQWADLTCFSFYPGKNLGAYGDAGTVVTNNKDCADTIRVLANHGRAGKYSHRVEGVNSRLDGIQSAILSVKLRHLNAWTTRRRECARLYRSALEGSGVITPCEPTDSTAVYHLYVVRVPAAKRDGLQRFLGENGIQTGIHYPIALPHLEAYSYLGHREGEFPNAAAASQEILSLPMFAELTDVQVHHVADCIRAFIGDS